MSLNCDLTHDLDPWFWRSNFEKVVTKEWDAWLTWSERDVSRLNVGPMLWLSTLTSPMTLTLNFQRSWHGTIGIWVDRVLCLLCDLELWLWPWILEVKFKKSSIIGIRGLIGPQCMANTLANLLAHEWAVHSLIYGLSGVVVFWMPCFDLFSFHNHCS